MQRGGRFLLEKPTTHLGCTCFGFGAHNIVERRLA